MPDRVDRGTVEVARYRIALTTAEDDCRTVLTCKDCRTAPVHGHPELEVSDPPICIVGTRRLRGSAIGTSMLVPAAFRHEIGVHPPDGVASQSAGGGAIVATPDGLRSLARTLDELAVLTKGSVALLVSGVTVWGAPDSESVGAPHG